MKKKLWLILSVFMVVSLALLPACTPAAQPTTAPTQPAEYPCGKLKMNALAWQWSKLD